jgi:hypothetical protein
MYVAGKYGGFYAASEYRKDFCFIRGGQPKLVCELYFGKLLNILNFW